MDNLSKLFDLVSTHGAGFSSFAFGKTGRTHVQNYEVKVADLLIDCHVDPDTMKKVVVVYGPPFMSVLSEFGVTPELDWMNQHTVESILHLVQERFQ